MGDQCSIRREGDGFRCLTHRTAWDADDVQPCGGHLAAREAEEPTVAVHPNNPRVMHRCPRCKHGHNMKVLVVVEAYLSSRFADIDVKQENIPDTPKDVNIVECNCGWQGTYQQVCDEAKK